MCEQYPSADRGNRKIAELCQQAMVTCLYMASVLAVLEAAVCDKESCNVPYSGDTRVVISLVKERLLDAGVALAESKPKWAAGGNHDVA